MYDFTADVEQCLEVLAQGGTILYPTDTVWGLGCDATNADAVKKIISIKSKPAGNGLIVLLASERDVLQYAASPDLEVFNYLLATHQPTTVIYEHGLDVAEDVLNEDGSIAIRLVGEDFCRHLIKRFRKPVVSTSANVHGQPSPQNFKSIAPAILNAVDYTVQYRQNEMKNAISSCIIRWHKGVPIAIRQ